MARGCGLAWALTFQNEPEVSWQSLCSPFFTRQLARGFEQENCLGRAGVDREKQGRIGRNKEKGCVKSVCVGSAKTGLNGVSERAF